MADIDVSLDDDIAKLLQTGKLKEVEAIQLQTLRETQRLVDYRKKKDAEPEDPPLRFHVTSRKT